ncbi:MAG: oligosaccharide flippase family protein [Flavobacteriales bacterium]|nr:oligosaccharide flippase family protein [Flavobacteriales bacterium]
MNLKLSDLFNSENLRSQKLKINILALILRKGITVLIAYITIPLILHYLTESEYGIWLTIYSVIGWFVLFDLGLGLGLRNRFAEAIAEDNHKLARTYVSTTYAILGMIAGGLLAVVLLSHKWVNWEAVFNVSSEDAKGVGTVVLITFSYACLIFFFGLIKTVLTADQRPALASYFNTIASAASLLIIILLIQFTEGSLVYLALTITGTNLFVFIVATIWLFRNDYARYRPSLKYIDFKQASSLMKLGISFFFLQLAGIIVYGTDALIISHLFGSDKVPSYVIALKYFSIVQLFFMIVSKPLLAAFIEARTKNEIAWIKSVINKLLLLVGACAVLLVVMLLPAQAICELWLQQKIDIPLILSIGMLFYVLFNIWIQVYVTYIDSTGKLRLSLYISIFALLANLPLSYYLAQTWLGVSGVIFATCICLLPDVIILPLQYYKLINEKATGIWNR